MKTFQQSLQQRGSHTKFISASCTILWAGLVHKFSTTASTKQTKVESPESALRKHMKKFILKVHPDLFADFPKQKQINEDSLSKLNQILDTTMKNRTGPVNNWMTSQPITLTFYMWKGERGSSDFKPVKQVFDIRGIQISFQI